MEETTNIPPQEIPQEVINEVKKVNPLRLILMVISILLLFLLLIIITTKKDELQENPAIKAQIDSLAKANAELQSKQATLDSISKEYELHLDDLDWKIDNVGEKKTIIREYYYDRVRQPRNYTPKQIDSFFKKRYNY